MCIKKNRRKIFEQVNTAFTVDNIMKLNDKSDKNQFSETTTLSKAKIIKNEIVICLSCLLLFCAYDGLALLQSTINHEKSSGVIAQALIYVCFCLSSIFFPKYVIKKFGSKTACVLSTLTYVPYIASNLYPQRWFMFSTAVLVGFGAPLFWGSQSTYVNDIAMIYTNITLKRDRVFSRDANDFQNTEKRCSSDESIDKKPNDKYSNVNNVCIDKDTASSFEVTAIRYLNNTETSCEKFYLNHAFENDQKDPAVIEYKTSDTAEKVQNYEDNACKVTESVTALFFGVWGMANNASHILSNIISYYVLHSERSSVIVNISMNSSCVCGADFCNTDSMCFQSSNLSSPSDNTRYILAGICTVLSFLAVLIPALFLDSLETDKPKVSFSFELVTATFKFAKRRYPLLLIPLSFHIGMKSGFYSAEYSKAYIGCALGLSYIGLVAICYGTVSCISSSVSGWLVKQIGRKTVISAALLISLISDACLLLWQPSAEHTFAFYAVSAVFAVYVGAILPQTRALYGVLFKSDEEAAFAGFHVWYSLGYCLSFAYSSYFCTTVKIYAMLAVSLSGYIGYFIVERLNAQHLDVH